MKHSEDRSTGPVDLPEPELPLTDCARRCLRRAQVIAWHQGVEVNCDLILMCLVLDLQEASRARLTLRAVGPFYEVSDNSHDVVERAEKYLDRAGYAAAWAPAVTTMVPRLDYWAQRTGDRGIDTAHLLLACLESPALDEAKAILFQEVSIRDVIRMAMSERYHVAESDRRPISIAPILSRARADRPVADSFRPPPPAKALLRHRNYMWRTWTAGAEHLNSFILLRVARTQVWLFVALQVLAAAAWAAAAYSSLFVNGWSIIALVPLLATPMFRPVMVRVAADAGLVALSVWQHLPWWLVSIVVLYHSVFELAGRLALLIVKSDVADPVVTAKDLRSDASTNRCIVRRRRLETFRDRIRRT